MTRQALLITIPIATFGLGYYIAPRDILDEEVKNTGFFQVDTNKVLTATVESLKAENSLIVWSYKGTAKVRVTRERWWVFKGNQVMIVPATVNYKLNLAELSLDKVEYNETAKIVTVRLPKLTLADIAFQPEEATTTNGGILTFSDETVSELRKIAFATARKTFIKQAQQKTMVDVAKRQARENVQAYFEIPLRIAGQPDVRVVATFD